ncbi:MAG: hypothetical protein ACT4QE_00040 [Anaerolineales bacterium]
MSTASRTGLSVAVIVASLVMADAAFACSIAVLPGETSVDALNRFYAPALAVSRGLWLAGIVATGLLLWMKRRRAEPMGWYNLLLIAALVIHPAWTVPPTLGPDCSVSTLSVSLWFSSVVAVMVGIQFWRRRRSPTP